MSIVMKLRRRIAEGAVKQYLRGWGPERIRAFWHEWAWHSGIDPHEVEEELAAVVGGPDARRD